MNQLPLWAVCIVGISCCQSLLAAGPDVTVSSLYQISHWTSTSLGGPVTENNVTFRAYSIGTVGCNIGNQQLDWVSTTNQHPVIHQAMYRLKDGRFEQVGISWLKHGFCALQQSGCGSCVPAGGGCVNKLGTGCSDPYDASLNADQTNLGPRWQVNPFSGNFSYPFAGQGQTGNRVFRRLKVPQNDLDPALNSGARYYIEGMYIHPDDAAAGNQNNNASHRRVTINSSYSPSLVDSTFAQQPAIFAWQHSGLGVGVADPDVTLTAIDVPGDGRFWLGYKVTQIGGDLYHYEYAIQNLNSDRAAGSFEIPVPDGTQVLNIEFRDCFYHSGEPFDNTDWNAVFANDAVTWSSPQSFSENPNSNALRWGTLYNYRFDAVGVPTLTTATLRLFKPGVPEFVTVPVLAPAGVPVCAGDLNGDGVTNDTDLGILLASFNFDAGGDLNNDGVTDDSDLGQLLAAFGCGE